jgi:hypothetical protein
MTPEKNRLATKPPPPPALYWPAGAEAETEREEVREMAKDDKRHDGLFFETALFGSIAMGQSNAGNRKDGKICRAQGGECRYNRKYYTPGMRDAKSWSMPCADDSCSERCPYLIEV